MRRLSPVTAFCFVLILSSLFVILLPGGAALAADWSQAADDGIAGGYKPPDVITDSMAVFGGNLYAGTAGGAGCGIWRNDGTSWTQVVGQSPAGTVGTGPGFGDAGNGSAACMAVYNNRLYVGTSRGGGCQIWRTPDGNTWNRVDGGALGTSAWCACSMAALGGDLYVGTQTTSGPCEVWRFDGTNWSRVVGAGGTIAAGFGNANNRTPSSMAVYGGNIYVGTNNTTNGSEVWFSPDGTVWGPSAGGVGGFGVPANVDVRCMEVFGGSLYAGTMNSGGCEIWSFNGIVWAPRAAAGITTPQNVTATSMAVLGGFLHVGTNNGAAGCQVIRTNGGPLWNRVDGGAMGACNMFIDSMAAYGGKIYAGTGSPGPGTEIWASAGAGGIPYTDWAKTNVTAFSPNANYNVYSMASFNGNLYAGTAANNGCEVWRFDGTAWQQVNVDGFGDLTTHTVGSMAVFNGCLYAGTASGFSRGQVWRSANGTDWTRVDGGALDANTYSVTCMAVFDGYLHLGTRNATTGGQVWRSADGTAWTRVDNGAWGAANPLATSMAVYKDRLYVGTFNSGGTGCQVWSTAGSGGPPYTDWTQANAGGFGDINSSNAASMAVYGGELFVGTENNTGCTTWKTAADVPTPADWSGAAPVGFGDTTNVGVVSMREWDGKLYAGTRNYATGCEVWSWDGSAWAQEDGDGFGGADNQTASCMAVYFDSLFVGTDNMTSGCEVWNTGSSWYLAEGATAGGFETWVLVQNPGEDPVHADFTLNTDTGVQEPPDLQGVEIPAGSRRSFNLGGWAVTYDVSTRVDCGDGRVICERAMYWTPGGQAFRELGHDSIGVTSPAATWYLAEGATAGGFETWVLVQNPGEDPVHADFTLNTDAGEVKPPDLQGFAIPAGSRVSFNIGNWVTTYDVSTRVDCADGSVICERAMYWTPEGQANRVLGHDSVGVTSPAAAWYLAEGATDGGFETWVLVQNPGADPVHVDFTLNTDTGVQEPAELQGVEIPAGSRRSFNLGGWATTFNVSTKVDCADGDVICERAMYWTPEGQAFRELGHDSVGVTAPSAVWYLAEGATAGGFETWVLVQNPGADPVHVDFTLNTDTGVVEPPELQGFEIPAGSRVSFNLGLFVTTFDASTRVDCPDGSVICERAMYWTPEGQTNRELGHDSIGYSP